jgi:carboxynorspermidine decarboxylase
VNVRLMSTKQAGANPTHSSLLDYPGSLPDSITRISTPAFVYDEAVLNHLLTYADQLRQEDRCRVLFAIKSFSFPEALKLMSPRLDGFAVSSLFEAKLAQEANTGGGSLHITTPGLRNSEIEEISSLCDYVSFNSLTQWDMFRDRIKDKVNCGLRVNPQLSFLDDERYDPCRTASKLGVPLEDLVSAFDRDPAGMAGVRGILFHSNCDSPDFGELLATVRHLYSAAGSILEHLEWINLGGGYLFEDGQNMDGLHQALDFIKSGLDVDVFFEPGSALIRSAGYIVSTVLDVFPSEGSMVAVLDTSVNHMPEVFEYDFEPDVVGHDDDAPNPYILAGCTCLAGDLFGEYRFPDPLKVGDKVIFNNAGSYTLTKAHVFNGIGLPSVYSLTAQGEFVLKSRYTFDQYAARWGVDAHATP